MSLNNAGAYAKTIVSVFGAIVTALSPYLAQYRWWPAVPVALTVLATYLIPNSQAPLPAVPPAPAVPPGAGLLPVAAPPA